MSTFANAVENQTTTTTNGMTAFTNASNAAVDLFFRIGAMRGKDIIPDFVAAYTENKDLALRIALWSRDVRGGAGERQLFRNILQYLENADPISAVKLANKIGEIGRWDDLLVFKTNDLRQYAFEMIKRELNAGNALLAKWLPRDKSLNKYLADEFHQLPYHEKLAKLSDTQRMKYLFARDFRTYVGWTPSQYRKTLATLSKVVETDMCANNWDDINFSHVPSLAASRYRNAFKRHTPKFEEYVNALTSGDPSVKVNAGAVYPYDVTKSLSQYSRNSLDNTARDFINAQWNSLPNYVGDAPILPMVDVSGSMECSAGKNANLTCMQVAISLGMYLAEKNTGKFKDMFLTFSESPKLAILRGDVAQRYEQLSNSKWGMTTNLTAAFELVLKIAKDANLDPTEMPEYILILSDMQFDSRNGQLAHQMIDELYSNAGYTVPKLIWWNLHAHDNAPVKAGQYGSALVSGFSPSIMTSVLAADDANFTPYGIMMQSIGNSKYDV